MRRTVAVIGGGPAGLMAGRLLARDHPAWEVTVYERLAPDDTYGFGVGLTPAVLAAVEGVTPDLHHELLAASASFHSAKFELFGETVELPSYHAGAISRARMLQILIEAARADGVDVQIGAGATLSDVSACDLVIAADGVSSTVRAELAAELGASEELGRGLFIWCGAEIELEGTIFMPVRTPAGTFVAHAYPYADGRATFVIESDPETVERAGCLTSEFSHEGDSDEATLEYLSAAFSELLGGGAFDGNRSRWMHFRTVRCTHWHHDNVVVLGDAAATAHPTLGSGTKLALEAAIGLAAAMRDIGDEPPASRLAEFERRERPGVEQIQDRARRSQLWWESFPSRLGLSPARIAFAYMSRAGAVSLAGLHETAPALTAMAVADYAGVTPADVPSEGLEQWVLQHAGAGNGGAPHDRGAELAVELDDPWGPEAQTLIERIPAGNGAGPSVLLTGAATRGALLDRLAFGERIRGELGACVTVACEEQQLPDAVDGLVAGRADLVRVAEQ